MSIEEGEPLKTRIEYKKESEKSNIEDRINELEDEFKREIAKETNDRIGRSKDDMSKEKEKGGYNNSIDLKLLSNNIEDLQDKISRLREEIAEQGETIKELEKESSVIKNQIQKSKKNNRIIEDILNNN